MLFSCFTVLKLNICLFLNCTVVQGAYPNISDLLCMKIIEVWIKLFSDVYRYATAMQIYTYNIDNGKVPIAN